MILFFGYFLFSHHAFPSMSNTWRIRVETQEIRVETRGIKVGCGESGWKCGESECECGESGWFFLRIFVFIASAKILEREGEHFIIQILWAAAQLLVTRFLPCLPNGWVLLQGYEDVGSVQDFTFLYLCLVWIRRVRTQKEFKIPLCDPSGGNLLLRQSHN